MRSPHAEEIEGFWKHDDLHQSEPLDQARAPAVYRDFSEKRNWKISQSECPVLFGFRKTRKALRTATRPVLETLEERRLLSLTLGSSTLYFNDPANISGSAAAQKLIISNSGDSPLTIPASGLSIAGANAAQFAITQSPTLPLTLASGAATTVYVNYTSTAIAIQTATLSIASDDPVNPTTSVALRGLGTAGIGGANEPSLQMILNLLQIPDTVGDPTPDTYDLPAVPSTPNDEVVMPIMIKAGSGAVTITPLASFGIGQNGTPTTRLGWYQNDTPLDHNELFTLFGDTTANGNSQTVFPTINGISSFDPGSVAFGLYAYWPTISIKSTIYSADSLNAFDSTLKRHIRFYPLKNPDGSAVPNAFVFAMEEFNSAYDQQDFVGVIRNVKAIDPSLLGPSIAFQNPNGTLFSRQLEFNRIEDPYNDGTDKPTNIFHDLEKLRIYNSGTSTLNISSIVASAGWQVEGTLPTSIAPGSYSEIGVRFIASYSDTTSRYLTGTLTVNSNDLRDPAATVALAGWWQPHSEDNKEPSLQQIVTAFGFKTLIAGPNQELSDGGKIERIGDEVLSPFWMRADSTLPVTAIQISAFHTQGNDARLMWYNQNSSTMNTLFVMDGDEAQSFLPHIENIAVGVVGSAYAAGTFNPTQAFGWRIDGEWSDPTKNVMPTPTDQGHHVRFWVARDASGRIVPNAYIMSMDYQGINYDYNDNTYLIMNVKPTSPPSAPVNLVATSTGGVTLAWTANTEANLGGYNIYRSTSASGPWTKLNGALLTAAGYVDAAAPAGMLSYYKVTAVDNVGNESAGAFSSATPTADTMPPAAPANLGATGSPGGISLLWSANSEIDLAGYNLYRASSASGPFIKLNSSLLTTTNFFDTGAAVGATSYYRVTAVDTSGNESAAASASATRPAPDTTPPAAPTLAAASTGSSAITLNWLGNTESDLAGYNVYRSGFLDGSWTKLNGSLLSDLSFIDAGAAPNTANDYRITAVDSNGNESAPATISVAGPDTLAPDAPASASSVHSTTQIILSWTASTASDLAGYNIYRSIYPDHGFVKINALSLGDTTYHDRSSICGNWVYYRITAVDTSGNESGYASTSNLRPLVFQSRDIGAATPGSTRILKLGRSYNLTGAGIIGGAADSFHYDYRAITGDFSISVRLVSLGYTTGAEEAGLMARESLAPGAKNAFAFVRPIKGYRMSYRTTSDGSTVASGSGDVSYPNVWIRLKRIGNDFTAFRSTDGKTWVQYGHATIAMDSTVFVGMAVASSTPVVAPANFRTLKLIEYSKEILQ